MHAHPCIIISIRSRRKDNHKISNVSRCKEEETTISKYYIKFTIKEFNCHYQLRFDMLDCCDILITPCECDCNELFEGEVYNFRSSS